MTAPIVKVINEAQLEFYKMYGFQPERIHVSSGIERTIRRWWASQAQYANLQQAEATIAGMEVLRMTKNRARPTEFWLSTERNGEVHAMQIDVEPHEVGATKIQLPGETIIESD